MSEADVKSKPVLVKLTLKDVEPHLKFPSGLSTTKAKERAKAISKSQDVSLSQAQMMVAWAHGCPTAKSWSQALEDILRDTWDWEINKTLRLFSYEEKGTFKVGVDFKEGDRFCSVTCSVSNEMTKEAFSRMISRAFMHKKGFIDGTKRQETFLNALKASLKKMPESYYSLSVPSIDDMKRVYDCDINLERIVDGSGCSHGIQILSEYVGSMYNGRAYARLKGEKAIRRVMNSENILPELDDTDIYKIGTYFNPDITADNLAGLLDEKSQSLVSDLMVSYQGW